MPAYVWITALAAVAFVGFVAFGRRWWHALWYSWSSARHVLADPLEEHYATVAEYGSMILAEEQHHEEWLPAPPVDPAPWLEQTMAALSPEALDAEPVVDMGYLSLPAELQEAIEQAIPPHSQRSQDSGPGEPSSLVSLGPVPSLDGGPTVSGPEGAEGVDAPLVQPSPWLAKQLAILYTWSDWQQEKARIFA